MDRRSQAPGQGAMRDSGPDRFGFKMLPITWNSLGLSRIAASVDVSTIIFVGSISWPRRPRFSLRQDGHHSRCQGRVFVGRHDQRVNYGSGRPNIGAVVVSYVNTTAAVKAETDICCTSSMRLMSCDRSQPTPKFSFVPISFLVSRAAPRWAYQHVHIWMGECHVHAGINGADLKAMVMAGERIVHLNVDVRRRRCIWPAAGSCQPSEQILSSGMITAAQTTTAESARGHRDRNVISCQGQPLVIFNGERAAVCKYMKMITPEKLLRSLREVMMWWMCP